MGEEAKLEWTKKKVGGEEMVIGEKLKGIRIKVIVGRYTWSKGTFAKM